MVDVICDTSFLIHLATARIRNLGSLEIEIGRLEFVVPQVVLDELEILLKDTKKSAGVAATLDFIKDFRTIPISGKSADSELVSHVKMNRCMVATMDRRLKKQIKANGGSVLSFSSDKIVLEPQ